MCLGGREGLEGVLRGEDRKNADKVDVSDEKQVLLVGDIILH